MTNLPLVHVAASIGIVLVVLRLTLATRRAFGGAVTGSPLKHGVMAVLGCVVFWQGSIWLTTAHPDATAAFRAGVIVQWLGGAALALLSAVNLLISRRRPMTRQA